MLLICDVVPAKSDQVVFTLVEVAQQLTVLFFEFNHEGNHVACMDSNVKHTALLDLLFKRHLVRFLLLH